MLTIVVAHPDDECIFAGGLILSNMKSHVRVIIACYDAGTPRAKESQAFGDRLIERGVDLELTFLGHKDVMRHKTGGIDTLRLLEQLHDLGVDRAVNVFSHNTVGEYGHAAHVAVGSAVRSLCPSAAQFCRPGGVSISDSRLLLQKRGLFSACYPSQQVVWSSLPDLMRSVMRQHELHG